MAVTTELAHAYLCEFVVHPAAMLVVHVLREAVMFCAGAVVAAAAQHGAACNEVARSPRSDAVAHSNCAVHPSERGMSGEPAACWESRSSFHVPDVLAQPALHVALSLLVAAGPWSRRRRHTVGRARRTSSHVVKCHVQRSRAWSPRSSRGTR